jgi:hypothetical protein
MRTLAVMVDCFERRAPRLNEAEGGGLNRRGPAPQALLGPVCSRKSLARGDRPCQYPGRRCRQAPGRERLAWLMNSAGWAKSCLCRMGWR